MYIILHDLNQDGLQQKVNNAIANNPKLAPHGTVGFDPGGYGFIQSLYAKPESPFDKVGEMVGDLLDVGLFEKVFGGLKADLDRAFNKNPETETDFESEIFLGPRVGMTVLYVPEFQSKESINGADVLPAIITRVSKGMAAAIAGTVYANLKVLLDAKGNSFLETVPYSPTREPGTWHFLEDAEA